MRTGLGTRGRWKAALLTFLLLTAVAGCGSRQGEQAKAGAPSEGGSSAPATVVAMAQDAAPPLTPSRSAGPIHRITLSDRRCIQFEPQWTSVRMGQTVTWHSELKSPIRIYVSPGVFARASFLVRPGATVTTGPALSVGRFSFWTEPTACRTAPRGVLLAGPGVRVQETYYASTGPR